MSASTLEQLVAPGLCEHHYEQRGKHELRAGFGQLVDDDDADAEVRCVLTHAPHCRVLAVTVSSPDPKAVSPATERLVQRHRRDRHVALRLREAVLGREHGLLGDQHREEVGESLPV